MVWALNFSLNCLILVSYYATAVNNLGISSGVCAVFCWLHTFLIFCADPLLLNYTVDTLLTRMHAVETTQKKIQETQDTVLKKLCEIEDYMRRRSLVNTPNLPEYNATSYDLYQDSYSPHYSPRSDDNVTLPIHLPCQKVDNEKVHVHVHVLASPPFLPIATSTPKPHPTSTQPTVPPTNPPKPPPNCQPLSLKTDKHKNPLPSIAIDRSKLASVKTVLEKYKKLRGADNASLLTLRLAQEAIYGDDVLVRCTVKGNRRRPGLPIDELIELKGIIFETCPTHWCDAEKFEKLWTGVLDKLGQLCKRLRQTEK